MCELRSPIRTCVVCSTRKAKADLLRLCMDPGTKLVALDTGQHMKGRGAYVCMKCLPLIRYNKRVQKAFRNRTTGMSDLCSGWKSQESPLADQEAATEKKTWTGQSGAARVPVASHRGTTRG